MVYLESAKYRKEKVVDYVREIHGAWVFKFKDVNTINEAYRLVDYGINAEDSGQPADEPEDVLDFEVRDVGGRVWGKVTGTEDHGGGNELLCVRDPDGNDIHIPITDTIIMEINSQDQVILIDPPEGLRDLNR